MSSMKLIKPHRKTNTKVGFLLILVIFFLEIFTFFLLKISGQICNTQV